MYYQHLLMCVIIQSALVGNLTTLMKEITIANSCVQPKGCVAPASQNTMYAINQTVGEMLPLWPKIPSRATKRNIESGPWLGFHMEP
jgi:hypothetical protein